MPPFACPSPGRQPKRKLIAFEPDAWRWEAAANGVRDALCFAYAVPRLEAFCSCLFMGLLSTLLVCS